MCSVAARPTCVPPVRPESCFGKLLNLFSYGFIPGKLLLKYKVGNSPTIIMSYEVCVCVCVIKANWHALMQ